MYHTDSIAILMATYNGEKYIREQLESILHQSNQEWELFIHDDGSADRTVEIISKYAEANPQRIHVVEGEASGGAKKNFFYLMKNVSAPYVMFSDQDDVWLKEKIEKTYEAIRRTEKRTGKDKPVLAFTDLKVVDQELNTVAERMSKSQQLNPRRTTFKESLIQNIVTGCTIMINRACAEKSLAVFDMDKIIMHDWWLALVASCFGEIVCVDEPLILYRQHGDNSVGTIPITEFNYIKRKMTKGDVIRHTLELTRIQAREFSKTYGLKENSLCSEYSRLGNKNKIERMLFYIKKHMWKSGLVRNLGLIIWG